MNIGGQIDAFLPQFCGGCGHRLVLGWVLDSHFDPNAGVKRKIDVLVCPKGLGLWRRIIEDHACYMVYENPIHWRIGTINTVKIINGKIHLGPANE